MNEYDVNKIVGALESIGEHLDDGIDTIEGRLKDISDALNEIAISLQDSVELKKRILELECRRFALDYPNR